MPNINDDKPLNKQVLRVQFGHCTPSTLWKKFTIDRKCSDESIVPCSGPINTAYAESSNNLSNAQLSSRLSSSNECGIPHNDLIDDNSSNHNDHDSDEDYSGDDGR